MKHDSISIERKPFKRRQSCHSVARNTKHLEVLGGKTVKWHEAKNLSWNFTSAKPQAGYRTNRERAVADNVSMVP